MKFKFPFETLLKQRKSLEELARKEFLEAQSKVDESSHKINHYWSQIDRARINVFDLQKRSESRANQLESFDGFIKGLKVKIEREKEVLRVCLMECEEKRENLVEAAKEYKILSRLKEKMKDKHKVKLKKKEMKELDDITVMRHKRRAI